MHEGEPIRDLKNIDKYEREKLERTLNDIELTLKLGKNYLAMVESADRQGIPLERETRFDRLRMPNELMGPGVSYTRELWNCRACLWLVKQK